jgi:DNA-binding Lrp family transcriptional regulator
MNALAAIKAETPAIPVKEQRISKRMRQVVELLVSGACQTQKAAAERLGLHPDYVCRELKKPQVQVFIERSARQNIAQGTMRASARLLQLVDASSEHVSLDASKYTLAIAGIKPTADAQVSVNIDIKAGYVIDLTDAQPMRTVSENMSSKLIDG